MHRAQPPRQAGAKIEITEEMIEAGKRELSRASAFGGESEYPCVDYGDVAKAVFAAMVSARSERHRSTGGS